MSHLTVEQRYVIEILLVQNKKKSEIAIIIGVSKSTVTREIQRNSDERSHILSLSACPEQKQEEEAGETKENLLHQISEDPCKRTDRIRIKP